MKIWKIIIANLLIVFVVIGNLFFYINREKTNAYKNAFSSFELSTDNLTDVMGSFFLSEQQLVNSMANVLEKEKVNKDEAIRYLKNTLYDNNLSFHIVWEDDIANGISTQAHVTDPNDFSVSYEHKLPTQEYEVTTKKVINEVSNSKRHINMTASYTNPINGDKVISFCQRITLLDNNEPRSAILLYVLPTSYLKEKWFFTPPYNNMYIGLVEQNGNYIIQPKQMKNSSFYEFMFSYNKLDQKELQEKIFTEKQGTYIAEDSRGVKTIYGFSVIDETGNNAIVTGIPVDDLVNPVIQWHIVAVSMLALAVSLVMNFLYFNAAANKNREHIRTIQEQGEKLELALEDARNSSKAKTLFLSNMSHDIRTPMNAIIGFTDLMEKNLDERDKLEDYIGKIKKSNELLLSLINNVLEMAKIESGEMGLDLKPCDFAQVHKTLESVFSEIMEQNKLNFVQDIRITHNYIYSDATKIREVFLNVLSNAIKYTPAGGTIFMGISELPSDREDYIYYRTVIKDTGIGMSKSFVDKIFEQFSRERNTTEGKVEGTGLGMSIVKKLVDLMDGTISIQSEPKKGTEVVVTIPHRIAYNLEAEAEEMKSEPNRGKVSYSDKRILLVEDNDLNAEIAIAILEEMGFMVERAADGAKCVAMIASVSETYYDLILMDIQMPVMNGYQATKVIRSLDDRKKAGIPIVAMTANAFEEDRKAALEVGMNGHVAKPINLEELNFELMKSLSKV